MKNWLGLIIAVGGMLLLSSCTMLPKDEFVDQLSDHANTNAGDFSFKMNSFDIKDANATDEMQNYADTLLDQLTGITLSGNYAYDEKNKTTAFNTIIRYDEKEIPLDLILTADKQELYISAEGLEQLLNIDSYENNETAKSEFTGKYLHLTEEELEKYAGFSHFSVGKTELTQLFSDYIKTLDRDTFTKEKEVLKHTFTKKELLDFVAFAKEKGDQKTADTLESFKDSLNEAERFNIEYSIHKNSNKQVLAFDVQTQKELQASLKMTLTITGKENERSVKVPPASDIVSEKQFLETYKNNEMEDYSDTYGWYGEQEEYDYTMTEEEFSELLAIMKQERDWLTAAEIEEYLATYQPILTQEQYKRLEEVLNGVSVL